MPITESQRRARIKHLGGSDIAAILGVDPFRGAGDVWLEKTGQLTEPAEQTEPMLAGTLFEPSIRQWAEAKLGRLLPNQYRSAPGLPIGANLDAIAVDEDPNRPVEIKTGGLYGPLNAAWGDDGTDQVPDHVIVQVHAQMMCMATGDSWQTHGLPDHGYIAAFLGGRGFSLFRVPRSDHLCEVIAERSIEFWALVKKRQAPPNSTPSLEVLKRVRREPNWIEYVEPGIGEAFLRAKDALKEAERDLDEAKAALIAAMGDAEGADCGDGGLFTFFEQTRSGIDLDRLRKAHPEIAKEFMRKSTYRVLRQRKRR